MPRVTRRGDAWRVEADVDGSPAWFETADAELVPRAEAFASAFLSPAATAGRSLQVDAPLCPTWQANVATLLPVFRSWWGLDGGPPAGTSAAVSASSFDSSNDNRLRVACFSGGADSFHTLLHSRHPIDQLLFVHGFDIPLADVARAAAFEPLLRSAATARGKSAVLLRTNLREHPLFAAANWEQTHGGALAAAAHVLGEAASLVIPSSYAYKDSRPWGSHWATDPLWSSAATTIIHDNAELTRRDKLRQMAGNPLLWDRLRVCWENLSATGNCSSCSKCVQTMTVLHLAGYLDRFTSFDQSIPLHERINQMERVRPAVLFIYDDLLSKSSPGNVRDALARLIDRSRPLTRINKARRFARRFATRCLTRVVGAERDVSPSLAVAPSHAGADANSSVKLSGRA